MSNTNNEETLTIELGLSIDSANAEAVEAYIQSLLEEKQPRRIILDAKDLVFMSSAGLRIAMKLSRRYDEVRIINTSPEVYKVFHMTGFTDIMEVGKKAQETAEE